MYIGKFQIANYKCYLDSGEVEFKPGFNILTGQNSAGKTALLEALTLQFSATPHVSDATVPFRGAPPKPETSARVTFTISAAELVALFPSTRQDQRFLPRPKTGSRLTSGTSINGSASGMTAALREMVKCPELQVSGRLERRLNQGNEHWTLDGYPLGLYEAEGRNPQSGSEAYFEIQLDANGRLLLARTDAMGNNQNADLRIGLLSILRTRIYRFLAERFVVGQCAFGSNAVLAPNAANLAEVLNVLDGNTARFQRLNALMREILPQVRHISVRPIPTNQVQILVWPLDHSTEKDYLAIPLNECGSGVAQVLAMLYVVVTSEHPQVIVVDEPQSFLHPGAVRKLIEVLKRYSEHQYIFATHSPAVITASEPSTVTIVRSTGGGARLEQINAGNVKDLQRYLQEIGARLSDVFGADSILWAEGETEERCFPKILRQVAQRSPMGTAVVGIRQTGDFSGRDRKRVLDLYLRLSQANTLIPPSVGFLFDRECLTEAEMADLKRMGGGGLVCFLPRRAYENYLIVPAAISALANSIEGFRPTPISEDEVRSLVEKKRTDPAYFCKGMNEPPANWLSVVDGAKMLEDIFSELSENRVAYRKTNHSVALTEWLIQNDPEALREVANLLSGLLADRNCTGSSLRSE